jgi:hypothetical protein
MGSGRLVLKVYERDPVVPVFLQLDAVLDGGQKTRLMTIAAIPHVKILPKETNSSR